MVEFRQEFIGVIQDVLLLFYSYRDRVLRGLIEFCNECKYFALRIPHENNRAIHCLQVNTMIKQRPMSLTVHVQRLGLPSFPQGMFPNHDLWKGSRYFSVQ